MYSVLTLPPEQKLQLRYQVIRRTLIVRLLILIPVVAIFLVLFKGTLDNLRYYFELKFSGKSVTTEQFSFTFESQLSASGPHYTLQYRFSPDGYNQDVEVTQDITNNSAILFLTSAKSIPISYLPNDPTQSAFIDKYDMPDFRFFAMLFLILVLAPLEILYRAWLLFKTRQTLRKSNAEN